MVKRGQARTIEQLAPRNTSSIPPVEAYICPSMRRAAFLLTLALYAFSVLDLHEWAHVPQSIAHWLEHHSDLGHHDEDGGQHHDEHGDHDPFGCDEHGACTAFSTTGIAMEPQPLVLTVAPISHTIAVPYDEGALAAFSGSKWNPPKA